MAAPQQTLEQFRELDLNLEHLLWPNRGAAVRSLLNVEFSPRYMPGKRLEDGKLLAAPKTTWCNVYLTDCIKAMGIAAPRHWMTSKGEPAAQGKGLELRANELLDWFETHGARYGWMSADSRVAQEAAARGHFVVVGWRNPKRPEPGHLAWCIGNDRITQAGAKNYFVCTVRMGFGRGSDSPDLEWYVQMDRPGGHNG
jgi:hypothetical protein